VNANKDGFDTAAAVTRSLLGWGVVAGPWYLLVGTVLAVTRAGFDLTRHQLSLLMLGDGGWMQRTNLIVSGLMTIAAAVGFHRALRGSRAATWAGVLLGVYGVGLLGSGTFPPDPMAGFPVGEPEEATVNGILHLSFGMVQFLALPAAAVVVAGWFAERGDRGTARYSRLSAAAVVVGFVGGAALSSTAAGVGLLWLAVVAGWAWLLITSLRTYRTVPHPDADRRTGSAEIPARS
jgi:hypothetical protein